MSFLSISEKSLKLDLTKYKTIVFDCHGVVLDSNITKIDSYFRTAKKLGATNEQAQALVDYHIKSGGVSRHLKFVWYLEEVLNQPATREMVQEYLDAFSIAASKGLMSCRSAEGLHELRKKTTYANWLIVTDEDQQALRTLLLKRSLADLFDGGIFGSPDNKDGILSREVKSGNIKMPALFLGDSRYDLQASMQLEMDFVFVSEWTDDPNWKDFCIKNNLLVYPNIKSL